jgi:mono/diheme cytochrome c family protein
MAACVIVLLAATSIGAISPPSDLASGTDIKLGSEIFHKRCAGCHNKQPGDSSPFGPPNLYVAFKGKSLLPSSRAEAIIAQGEGTMPAFGNVLSKGEIRSVIAYLRAR